MVRLVSVQVQGVGPPQPPGPLDIVQQVYRQSVWVVMQHMDVAPTRSLDFFLHPWEVEYIMDGVVVVEQVGIGGDAKHFIFERLDDAHVGFAGCAS